MDANKPSEQPINIETVAMLLQHQTMMLCMMADRFEMLEARIAALEAGPCARH